MMKPITKCVAMAMAASITASAFAADSLFDETKVTTLFAFDQGSIPFTENLRIKMRQPVKHTGNPVVPRGPKGSPDSWAVQFYGSVVRVDGKFRMWYVAAGEDRVVRSGSRSAPWRVAYAESSDGLTWTKPNLGLVEYNGGKDNNLVNIETPPVGLLNVKVLYEPEAATAERYKMSGHAWFEKGEKGARFGTLALFISPDGLNWKSVNGVKPVDAELVREDMVIPWVHYEPSGGLYKWDGLYYTSGQNAVVAAMPYHGRIARAFVSGDFKTWSQASATQFVRTAQFNLLGPGKSRDGEQQHEGVSVWNRNNVLLGVYGIWHGAMEWRGVTIDLGFVVSNDGLNFREPAHDWKFVPFGADKEWDEGGVLQGQGFENIGDQTYVYYGAWDPRGWEGSPPRGGVGIVTVPRDRFGDLVIEKSAIGKGEYQVPDLGAVFMTAAIPLKEVAAQGFYMNAAGLGSDATIKVELLTADLKPIPGYSGADAAVVSQSGFQTPISWGGKTQITGLPDRVRIRGTYEGKDMMNIEFSALYIKDEATR